MKYYGAYNSPIGKIFILADETALLGLWFEGQKHFKNKINADCIESSSPILEKTKNWLNAYFLGEIPNFNVPIKFAGTKFQNQVWEILCSIPYGKTITYGEIAKRIAKKNGKLKMSAQAVGNAVAKNDISIIVPCHRVIGANGNLTGYAGGLDKKTALLKLEHTI